MKQVKACCQSHRMQQLPCAAHLQDLSVEEFVSRFEAPRVPVVITGLAEGWRAAGEWTPERLVERFGEHKFKVGVGAAWTRRVRGSVRKGLLPGAAVRETHIAGVGGRDGGLRPGQWPPNQICWQGWDAVRRAATDTGTGNSAGRRWRARRQEIKGEGVGACGAQRSRRQLARRFDEPHRLDA